MILLQILWIGVLLGFGGFLGWETARILTDLVRLIIAELRKEA